MTALRSITLRTIAAVFVCTLLTAGSALAGPPLVTDDAGTVDVSKLEVELNGSYTRNKENGAGVTTKSSTSDAEMKITTGLYKNLGVSLTIPYTISKQIREDDLLVGKADGFGDMTVELKYAFAELGGVNFAIKPAIIMPTGKYSAGLSEGRWQSGTTLIATREFDEGKYALHANLGYEHHDYRSDETGETTRSNFWSGSIAGEATLRKGLTAVADFGLSTTGDRSTAVLSVYALAGARYEINEHLDVNAGIKLGLTKPEDDISGLYGLTLKF